MQRHLIVVIALVAGAGAAHAQAGMSMSMPMPGDTTHHAPTVVTALARQQIGEVARSVRRFASTDSAGKAGFAPVFGDIPTMGVHWVDNSRMSSTRFFDMDHPNNLMYVTINGHDSLVGAAYAFFAPAADTSHPASTFDGHPAWHEHANLAPPGQTLTMLHVWFVPSPDGPFAGHNPYLPYWAAGLTPPDAARLKDPAEMTRLRLTAMALAEVADSGGLFPTLSARPALHARLMTWHAAIQALIPELAAAQRAGDWARWDRAADQAVVIYREVRQAYLDTAITADGKARVEHFLDEEETGMHAMAGMH